MVGSDCIVHGKVEEDSFEVEFFGRGSGQFALHVPISNVFQNLDRGLNYLDHLAIVRGRHVDADVDNFEHGGVVVAGVVLFEAVVVCCLFVVFHGEGPFIIFFVYLCYSFLSLCHIAHPV